MSVVLKLSSCLIRTGLLQAAIWWTPVRTMKGFSFRRNALVLAARSTVMTVIRYSHICAEVASEQEVVARAIDEPTLPRHYATINVVNALVRAEQVMSVGSCQTAATENYLEMGAVIGEAINAAPQGGPARVRRPESKFATSMRYRHTRNLPS